MSLKNCYEKCHVVAVSFTILESTYIIFHGKIDLTEKKQIENGTWLAAYSPDTVHHHLFAQKNKNLCEMVFRVMLYVIDWLIDSILKQKKIYEKPFCTTILTNFYNHIIYYIYFLHKLNSKKYHVSSNILLSDMFPIMIIIIIEIVVI